MAWIRSNKGQLVIEYMLLIVVAAALAAIMAKALVGRSDSSPGLVVKKWKEIQQEIGDDLPDRCVGQSCSN